jgi:hypothetical protein
VAACGPGAAAAAADALLRLAGLAEAGGGLRRLACAAARSLRDALEEEEAPRALARLAALEEEDGEE